MLFHHLLLSFLFALPASARAAQGPQAPPAATPSRALQKFVGWSLPAVTRTTLQIKTHTTYPNAPPTIAPITAPTTAPTTTAGPGAPTGGAGEAGEGGMTIDIVNSWSSDLYVSYGSNAGGPSPVGNPGAGPLGTSTRVVVPTGWAGRIYVGPGPTVDPMGTKVEGSTTGEPDIDVSYVDGYSVPVTCSVAGQAVVGCNIDLYESAQSLGLVTSDCPTGCSGQQVGSVCYNPSNNVIGNGPAPPFFAPCVGAAYTFPNDNVANVGSLPDNHVVCCVGTSCPAPARQGHEPNAPSKRRELVNDVAGKHLAKHRRRGALREPGSGTLLASGLKGQLKVAKHAVAAA